MQDVANHVAASYLLEQTANRLSGVSWGGVEQCCSNLLGVLHSILGVALTV